MSHWRDWDVALFIAICVVALFAGEIIGGIRTYRRGRDLARQITQEQEARDFLDRQWKESQR
jgi:hypothetical protein